MKRESKRKNNAETRLLFVKILAFPEVSEPLLPPGPQGFLG